MGRRRRKTDTRVAPEEISRLKRELGLDKQFLGKISSYVRFEKTASQIIGQDNTAPIMWQDHSFNLGGRSVTFPTSRLKVPYNMTGLWRVSAVINLDGATVKPNSNYRLELWVNDVLELYQSNQSTTVRQMTARFDDDWPLTEGDEVQLMMTNNTTGGTVTIEDGHLTARFLGSIE